MARQQSTTRVSFPQESPAAIARAALYARVSTLNNQDPEMQLAELREYAGRRGWQIVEEFTDQAFDRRITLISPLFPCFGRVLLVQYRYDYAIPA